MKSEQCKETVYVRDTYRYTGRVKGGFQMHLTRRQCSRKAQERMYLPIFGPLQAVADQGELPGFDGAIAAEGGCITVVGFV